MKRKSCKAGVDAGPPTRGVTRGLRRPESSESQTVRLATSYRTDPSTTWAPRRRRTATVTPSPPERTGAGGADGRQPPQRAQGGDGGDGRAEPPRLAAQPRPGVGGGPAGRGAQGRHPALDDRRAEPDRHLGPQARPAAGEPRPLRGHPDPAPRAFVCEHLPKQAAMLDKFTLIRSVDARHSNHEPNEVFQTGNLDAEPRANPQARYVPGHRLGRREDAGGERPGHAPVCRVHEVAVHLAFGGYLGKEYDPFIANDAAQAADLHQRGRRHRPQHRGRFLPAPARADARSPPRPPGDAAGLRRAPGGDRPLGLDGGHGPLRPAGGRAAGRPPGARRLRPLEGAGPGARAVRGPPLVPAGAASRIGWSRRGSPS